MSLYAIGDLHLHFQTDLKAKAQLKDRAWKNHEQNFCLSRAEALARIPETGSFTLERIEQAYLAAVGMAA